MKSAYRLFKRRDKKVWYFYYYKDDKRKYQSTGETKKYDAEIYAEEFLNLNGKHQGVTLAEYAKDFFSPESCGWLKRQLSKGKGICKSTAKAHRTRLLLHIIPAFGHFDLKRINPVKVENWLISLSLSSLTINQIRQTFNVVFREAFRERIVEYNPISDIDPIPGKVNNPRSPLSIDEIKRLFPCNENELTAVWGSIYKSTLFYTILTTGMRSGEIAVLRWSDILLEQAAIIIQRAYKADKIIGTTKSGHPRACYVPTRTLEMLKRWKQETPYNNDDDLVFYGETRDRIKRRNSIMLWYYDGLKNAGIDRTNRRLDIHGLRFSHNTMMRGILPEEMLRFQIGHGSEKMTDYYDKAGLIEKLNRFAGERGKMEEVF